MSATTATPSHRTTSPRIEKAAEGTRKDITATFESIRSTAGDVGDRVPGLVDGARTRAAAGAREIDRLARADATPRGGRLDRAGRRLGDRGSPPAPARSGTRPGHPGCRHRDAPRRSRVRLATRGTPPSRTTNPSRRTRRRSANPGGPPPCSTPRHSFSPTRASTPRPSRARHGTCRSRIRGQCCGARTYRAASTPRSTPRRRRCGASSSSSPVSGGAAVGSRSWWPRSSSAGSRRSA